MSGLFVVFEGPDGAGKSTTMRQVAKAIRLKCPTLTVHETQHPGATPLGAHIRKLVKYSEDIDPNIVIDNLSRQTLYMVDTIAFIKQKLEPALANNEVVLADRSSFISALVYGMAEGLNPSDIDRLFQLITPPKMNRLYVLRCPWQVGRERLTARAVKADHFESKPTDFFVRIENIYNNLLTGPQERTLLVSKSVNLSDVIWIDSTTSIDGVVDVILNDIDPALTLLVPKFA